MYLPKPQRRPELDALRGLFLVWMTLTHLPTRFSDFVNQTIGFVSSAEGFVFLSALLVGRIYLRQALEDGSALRARLWQRSLRIYAYHLLMLALAFTVVAAYAVTTHRAAIYNLLDFYIAHPFVAIAGSILLLYCPPLLDILPMYVIFLFFTPLVLSSAGRRGWGRILTLSGTIWLLAQFGLRDFVHGIVVYVTHLPIPLQETGSFNLFAWQAVWIAGLWLGAKSAEGDVPLKRIPGYVVAASAAICLFFIGIRYEWLGPHLTQQALGMKLDKWQIGPLRVVNLVTFTIVFYWMRKYVLRIVAVEPFLTLGKASLHVFCAHVFFVFVGLALLYSDVPQLHGWVAITLLAVTFAALVLVAVREVRKQREARAKRERRKQVMSAELPVSVPSPTETEPVCAATK
ncbi:OpgC domain-containing protein [Alloacidobacterium sp.]|uniref:OpgC domain-containing protein n=1 Tax=Alloacidobacterium sp. TaxID=2951999 RepID=UPI002D2B25AA|nr:OpgC domain-containing protein [Alloacidobacterium sp.]HYK36040.1 OpgC domain-containing protein [Alloacidobacterium sp.]